MNYAIRIVFLTPCFSHGAVGTQEIRPASIRGMLHHWFRIVGGSASQERLVFGGVNHGDKSPFHDDSASRVVVRVRHDANLDSGVFPTLPHKTGNEASPRKAFAPGHSFELLISDRLGGLREVESALFNDALYAWLLMGTLGFRSTRAAGSFSFETEAFSVPATPEEYEVACQELLSSRNARMRVAVLDHDFSNAESARCVVSDSLGGNGKDRGPEALQDIRDPLGRIKPTRKTSPLKYRIVRFGEHFRILATWDDREKITGNRYSDLHGAIDVLANHRPKPKEIGLLLRESSLYED